jgi:hypothetical protein
VRRNIAANLSCVRVESHSWGADPDFRDERHRGQADLTLSMVAPTTDFDGPVGWSIVRRIQAERDPPQQPIQ